VVCEEESAVPLVCARIVASPHNDVAGLATLVRAKYVSKRLRVHLHLPVKELRYLCGWSVYCP
jgi:hypothetical protein